MKYIAEQNFLRIKTQKPHQNKTKTTSKNKNKTRNKKQ